MPQNEMSDEGFVRDEHNQALLCADVLKRDQFMRKRREQQRVQKLEEDFSAMKSDVEEIKQLLKQLIPQNA